MIKPVQSRSDKSVSSVCIEPTDSILYIGQSGTSGYASAAKGYIADYILKGTPLSWKPLIFDNSKNDKNYYVDALAESVINRSYNKFDKAILHCTPDLWESFIKQHNNINNIIGYCTWETSKLPKKWVSYINMANEVWVPSSFNKECFENSGVKSKIKVVPHVWHHQKLFNKSDVKIYDYCRNLVPNNKYTFYSIGELNYRKGIEDLIRVFDKINDDYKDTQLLLKIHYRNYDSNSKEYCISQINSLTNKLGTSIYIILDNLSREEIVALHSFGDCYVSLNKGEGFGLTIFDAFNFGKKIITTGYGGQIEYLGKNYDGLVNYEIKNVDGMTNFSTNYSNDQEWAYPDLDDAYRLMEEML